MSSPSWHRQAACRDLDPELFFPGPGNSKDVRAAKAVCATCPVRAECHDAGRFEHFGIWGGTTRKERQLAETGNVNGRVPVRGCWICAGPVDYRHRYCSDECRRKARDESQRRYHQKKKWEAFVNAQRNAEFVAEQDQFAADLITAWRAAGNESRQGR